MMNIEFGQIYVENASFDLSGMLLGLLMDKLDTLEKEIPHFTKIYKGADYKLALIISAKKLNKHLVVKGPIILRKNPTVEFVLFLPYRKQESFSELVTYVFPYLAEGLIWILNKYKVDAAGVMDKTREALEEILANPEAFQYVSHPG